MLTNGGHGIALLWPMTDERYFFPLQVIEVSPIGIRPLFSERGLRVLSSELVCVWLPALAVAATAYALRRRR
jgi:inner membrane protein